MKQNFLSKVIFLSAFVAAVPAIAQVTIDQSNFPREAEFTDISYRATPTSFTIPTEGTNQVWDYSGLQVSSQISIDYYSAAGDPIFPNALNYRENDLIFQVFPIPSNSYDDVDAEGWYNVGRTTADVSYSISNIIGGPNDSLRFVGGGLDFEGRINTLKFPMTYGSAWTETHTEITNYQLSVAAFALNKTPGQQKRYQTHQRQVVGHGQLTIPKTDGSSGNPMNVLLIKVKRSSLDSTFLGGAPAPAPLMSAFGLTQGAMVSDSFYVFYRPDFAAPVLNVNLPFGSDGLSAFYRPQANDVSSAVVDAPLVLLQPFPNPIQAGQQFTIQLETSVLTKHHVRVYDGKGALVMSTVVLPSGNHQLQMKVPADLAAGLYHYQVIRADSGWMGVGKIQVVR